MVGVSTGLLSRVVHLMKPEYRNLDFHSNANNPDGNKDNNDNAEIYFKD